MIIPKPIYEILPITYVLAGIACISISESTSGLICSTLLAITGLLILIIRRNYRAARQNSVIETPALFGLRL
jgi:hypothetical protein